MNCGIEVLKRLNEIIDIDLNEVIYKCEKKVNDNGLSMYDLYHELKRVLDCEAIASLKLIKQTPFIAFIGFDHKGHYVLVEKIDKYVYIYDPAGKYTKCTKLFFYMIWSKKAIVLCYTNKSRGAYYDNIH